MEPRPRKGQLPVSRTHGFSARMMSFAMASALLDEEHTHTHQKKKKKKEKRPMLVLVGCSPGAVLTGVASATADPPKAFGMKTTMDGETGRLD
jgi:hypothetical protein